MKTITACLTFLLLISAGFAIDYSSMPEKSVSVQVDGADDLQVIPSEKGSFSAGEGIIGYNSKLRVKGAETATKFKKGTGLVFYVRKWSQAPFSLSCVKMNIEDDKKTAESRTGMSSDKDVLITSIPFSATEVDKEKGIYKVTLNNAPEVGVWCINFYNVAKGKFIMGSGYGKEVYCFEITE